VYGLFLLAFIFLAPGGIAGFMRVLWVKLVTVGERKKQRAQTLEP